ncbi:thiamine phosphate synthase [Corynebacterium sp. H78]|uniref:thiamine phosphate synthase n=1 Tax=Corynebacterium sp. H78 TaxID=3133417 RepID=UPI00309CA8D6
MASEPLLQPITGNSAVSPARERRQAKLREARLYVCTDARADRGDLREFLHAAYEGGVDIIQLRDKKIDARSEIDAVEVLADVASKHDRLFAVNDRADVAALVDADILHVGQEDLTTAQVRRLLGDDILVGRSNRNADMFAESLADPGIDYAVIGPVWATPTKPNRAAVGLDTVRAAAAAVAQLRAASSAEAGQRSVADVTDPRRAVTVDPVKPWWAIGGIDQERVGEVIDAGAERIVVVRAITDAANPEEAARMLKEAITQR